MASTYENDLRLEEMATGENSGSWGTKTNTNLELIADAFSYGTETIANADTTITIADGAADAARSLALKINSSEDLTTTRVVTLAPNTTSKVWIIENNTSGGQTLTISAGSGTNITLENGRTKIIATDGIGAGSNVVELTQDIAIADLFVDDDLTVGDDIIMDSDGGILKIGADADLQVTHSGSAGTITNATGDLSLDVAGDIILDADGADVKFRDGGAGFFTIRNSSLDAVLKVEQSNEDLIIRGNDGGSEIDALTLDMSDAGRAIFNDGLLSNNTNDIRKAQITSQYDTSSFLRLHPSATTDSGGYTNMFFGTSTDNNYGVAIGGVRTGSDSTPSFRIRTHNDSITGVDVLTINNSGVSTFRSGATFNENGDDADFRVESDNNANMLFVDAGGDHVNVGTSTDLGGILNVSGSIHPILHVQSSSDGTMAKFVCTDTDANVGPVLELYRNSTSPADNDLIGAITFFGQNSAGSNIEYAKMRTQMLDVTSGTEDARFVIQTRVAGAGRERLMMTDGETNFNDDGYNLDFRVESDGNANMLFLDASANKVGIGSSSFNYGTALTVHGNEDAGTPSSVFLRNSGTSGGSGNRIECGYVTGYGAAIRFSGNPSSYRMYGTYFERITGDGPTYATSGEFGTTGIFKTYEGVVHNENGGDKDFRVESDSSAHMLFVDAGTDQLLINGSSGSGVVNINKTSHGQAIGLNIVDTESGNGTETLLNLTNNSDQDVQFKVSQVGATIKSAYIGPSTNTQMNFSVQVGNLNRDLYLDSGSLVVNQDDRDYDFRVESVNQPQALWVDAENDVVKIGGSGELNPSMVLQLLGAMGLMQSFSVNSTESRVAEGTGGLFICRDDSYGGVALVLYEFSSTPTIIAQTASNFITSGTPTGTQVKFLAGSSPAPFGMKAVMASGQSTTLKGGAIICDPS